MSNQSAEALDEATQQPWVDDRALRLTGPVARIYTPAGAAPVLAARAAGNVDHHDTSPQTESKRVINPVVFKPQPHHGAGHFSALQRWEGVVTEVGEDTFTARLIDKTSEGPDEEAEIPIDEVSRPDRDLLTTGAVFYWGLGYLDRQTGQRSRESMIRFRRLPAWSSQELDDARRRAEGLRDKFGK